MKPKFIGKIVLDLIMSGMLLLLMGYPVTSITVHEWVGILFGVCIVVHLVLGATWIRKVFLRLFQRKQTFRTYVRAVLSVVLVLDLIVMVLSGIFISRTIFTGITTSQPMLWKQMHMISTYGGLLLIAIHMGMYWKVVMGFFRRMFKMKSPNVVRTWLLRAITLLLALAGIKGSFDRGMGAKFLPVNSGKKMQKETPVNKNSVDAPTDSNRTESGGNRGGKKGHGSSESSESIDSSTLDTPSSEETLNDYLGRLICTGCGKQCSLLSPQCGRGTMQASQATTYYNEATGKEASADSSSDDATDSIPAVSGSADITLKFEHEEESMLGLLTDYGSIMGLYIAGTYYSLEIIEKVRKKKEKQE